MSVRGLRLNNDMMEQIAAFGSQLILSASSFVVMFLASITLSPAEFSALSLANTHVMFLSAVLDFGMNQACLKFSFERTHGNYVYINVAAKFLIFCLCFLGFFATMAIGFPLNDSVILVAAAAIALWTSTRIVEQSARRFFRYSALNVVLGVLRVTLGLIAVRSQDWPTIILFLHVLAQLPIHIFMFTRHYSGIFRSFNWTDLKEIAKTSPVMFGSSLLFNAIPLITQRAIYSTGDVAASSAFAMTLVFMAPLDILVTTLRVYILPQALASDRADAVLFGIRRGGMHWLSGLFFLALCVVTIATAAVIEGIYRNRYPEASTYFLIFFGANVVNSCIAFYNIRGQRSGLVHIELLVNIGRAGAIMAMGMLSTLSPLGLVIGSGIILVSGEVVLFGLLSWSIRNRRTAPPAIRPHGAELP